MNHKRIQKWEEKQTNKKLVKKYLQSEEAGFPVVVVVQSSII